MLSIYELLFQFSSMSSGNVSEKNLTIDLKSDFKEMIAHLMSLSFQEKIKKSVDHIVNLRHDDKKRNPASSIVRLKNNGEISIIRP